MHHPSLRPAVALLLAGGSGLLYGLLLPPWDASGLAWLALVPLLVALARATPWQGAGLGLAFAGVGTVAVAWWFPGMLERYFALSSPVAWLCLAGLAVLVDGWPYAIFGACVSLAARRGFAGPLLVGAGFVLVEWLRAHGPVPNPFAQIGYSQSGTHVSQLADVGGSYAVGFVLVSANAALASVAAPELARRRARSLAAVLVLVAGAHAYGALRLAQPFGEGEPTRVALVQGAIARELRFDPSPRGAHLDRYLELTRIASAARPELVFWPEFAVDFYLQEPTLERARLLDDMRAVGADLVLGGSRYEPAASGTRYFNSVYVVDASGRLRTDHYDKQALIPFAEYGPFGDWLRADTAVYAAGTETRPLPTRKLRLGAFICGESLFPEIARELARGGADVLTNPSNDYWFGRPEAAAHQLQVAAYRAIENRRYLVRATSTGISAVVDPHGRSVVTSRSEGPEVLHASVRRSSVTTIYQRIGDLPLALAGATWIGCALRALGGGRARDARGGTR